MKIAVLGPQGTFSDKAYLQYAETYKERNNTQQLEPIYFPSIDEVFAAVDCDDENKCDIGIAPIENTLDGYVMRTVDLLYEKEVEILEQNLVTVQFSAVGNIDKAEDIKKLYVQFKAKGQCREFVSSLNNVAIYTTESNMESYYNIKNEFGEAAIVPKHIADLEKEMFKIDNVTDSDSNYTRFIVFKRKTSSIPMLSKELYNCEKIRISMFITPKMDRPGVLCDILQPFYEKEINLVSIMSRPTRKEMGTYNFYVEIEMLEENLDVLFDSLKEIKIESNIKLLGIYNE